VGLGSGQGSWDCPGPAVNSNKEMEPAEPSVFHSVLGPWLCGQSPGRAQLSMCLPGCPVSVWALGATACVPVPGHQLSFHLLINLFLSISLLLK
jgi:hypothetical protein